MLYEVTVFIKLQNVAWFRKYLGAFLVLGKAKGKKFNHLAGLLPSWDDQYRVASVHGFRPAKISRKSQNFYFYSPPQNVFFFFFSPPDYCFLLLVEMSSFQENWKIFRALISKQCLSRGAEEKWSLTWMLVKPAALKAPFWWTPMLGAQGHLVWGPPI